MALPKKRILLVERERASTLILLSVISFAATVVGVRLFLELTGYPQVGGGALHIAHLLWGGLAMIIGLFIMLIWDNPDLLYVTSILSGVGIGLFIDEVGKFITKNNDYFFPAAAPIIYAIFLVVLIVYLLVRRRNKPDPRRAMVLALEEMKEYVYGEVDEMEGERIINNLATAMKSDNPEIARLATLLHDRLAVEGLQFVDYHPGPIQRISRTLKRWGMKLGQKWHHRLILLGLLANATGAFAFIVVILIAIFGSGSELQTAMINTVNEAALAADAGGVQGQIIHMGLNVLIGFTAIVAIIQLVRGKTRSGMGWALIQIILSLTLLQLVTFYLTQFTAVFPTIFQFVMLGLVLTYQRWYLYRDDEDETESVKTSA